MVNLVKIGPVDPQMIGLKEIIKKKLTLAEHIARGICMQRDDHDYATTMIMISTVRHCMQGSRGKPTWC